MSNEVFQRKEPRDERGFTVAVVMGLPPTKGAVGIEIEVEGNKFPKPAGYNESAKPMPGLNYWSCVKDGSLRGQDNAEYVLTKPIEFAEVPPAVGELFSLLSCYGSVIDESNRTSVHVHLNCQEFHFNRLTSLVALYIAVEEILTEWCGEHRVGNLFCLRTKDAPAVVSTFRKFVEQDGRHKLSTHLHYAGLNIHSLAKYGSIEVRTMRGVSDPTVITKWVAILQRIYELSAEFTDPRDIPNMFSSEGPMRFFDMILGEHAETIRADIGYDYDRIRTAMYDGIRRAQEVCFCRDWSVFKTVDLQPDPFNRDPRKILNRLSQPDGATAGTAAGLLTGSLGPTYTSPYIIGNVEPDYEVSEPVFYDEEED